MNWTRSPTQQALDTHLQELHITQYKCTKPCLQLDKNYTSDCDNTLSKQWLMYVPPVLTSNHIIFRTHSLARHCLIIGTRKLRI
jgi:hypothetical protein